MTAVYPSPRRRNGVDAAATGVCLQTRDGLVSNHRSNAPPSPLAVAALLAPAAASAQITRVSIGPLGQQADGRSGFEQTVRVSENGRFVLFGSEADNLVAGDTDDLDLFVRDRRARTTSRIAPLHLFNDEPALSPDGRYVAYLVPADPVPALVVFDRDTGRRRRVPVDRREGERSLGRVTSPSPATARR